MKKKTVFPQVLFLGNGLNRAFGANDWSKLLKQIHSNPRITFEQLTDLPYPLQAVLATGDDLDAVLKEDSLKEQGISDIEAMRPMTESLLRVPFDHILTTNYTYELEAALNARYPKLTTVSKGVAYSRRKQKAAEFDIGALRIRYTSFKVSSRT